MPTRRRFVQGSLALMAAPLARGGDRFVGRPFATRSEVIARHGMAATSQPLATQAALRILQKGGSAVDAAIAADAMLGLTEPTGAGIGGDIFAIVWDARGKRLHGLNGSGRSPYSLTLDELRSKVEVMPPYGPLPVTVPGCVDGWFALHGKFGKLPMTEILDPAISYANEGFHLSEVIAAGWAEDAALLKDYPGFAPIFMPKGRAPVKGERFRNPFLAATLDKIARGGRDVYYKGEIAERISAYMKEQGGYLGMRDLADHHAEWVEPVSTNYRGLDLWELPPNGQGIAALQILNILEGFDLAGAGFGSPKALHWMLEAKKLAYEDRGRWYADPQFAKVPVEWLVSKEYAAERRALIKEDAAALRPGPGMPKPGADTVYLTVADSERNMVSLIQSNYQGMGSGMTPHGLGFVLHDRGQMFNLNPAHPNAFAPHKRPFHTIIPAFITKDGQPWMSYGVMGGDMQPQGHTQILVNMHDYGMNAQEAGDAPRWRHEGSTDPGEGIPITNGGEVFLESGYGDEVAKALAALGHRIRRAPGNYGGYQAIRYDAAEDVYLGASESRFDGQAAGY